MRKCKPKKCRHCSNEFTPWNSTQVTCNLSCAIGYIEDKAEKKLQRAIKTAKSIERKDRAKRKEALKTRSDHEKAAQRECNKYIKLRDKDDACISCGTTNPNIQYCAGHYKTVGSSPEIRYHPLNIHKQCNFHCNSQKSGNISEYRPELIKKIGLSNVEFLEGGHKPQNRTIDDLKDIKLYFRELIKGII